MKGVPHLVTVKGGGYFFMPGRSAMRYLARLSFKALAAGPAPLPAEIKAEILAS